MVRIGNFFFRYRNGLFPFVFLLAFLAGSPGYPFDTLDNALDAAGAALALLGQALRMLTIGYEYIIRGGRNSRVYADTLVQGGVFAHCRNPLYIGNLLIALGLALLLNSYAFYLIFIPFILLAYTSIVAAEEAYLNCKFGAEYEKYRRRVNRWWPRWTGWSLSVKGMRFNWKRVLVKEYNTTFVLVVALPCVELWSVYRAAGASALPSTECLTAAMLLWLSLYLFVWILKKSGYVRG